MHTNNVGSSGYIQKEHNNQFIVFFRERSYGQFELVKPYQWSKWNRGKVWNRKCLSFSYTSRASALRALKRALELTEKKELSRREKFNNSLSH